MVGGEKKNNLIKASAGLIFPVLWDEPFGLAITESMYFGCPVFGTPRGSLPELVNEDLGFLSNDYNKIAEALKNADNYNRKFISEYARENFNSKIMAEKYFEKYLLVLNGKKLNNHNPISN
jgi:glycosyltransferase involved in cell wall biosynthesis